MISYILASLVMLDTYTEKHCKALESHPTAFSRCIDAYLLPLALDRTVAFEGFRSCPYPDAGGYSRGHGEYLGPKGKDAACVTKEEAYKEAASHMLADYKKLSALQGWQYLPPKVRVVLLDMSYNLGYPGLMKFRETLSLIAEGKYCKAATRIMYSKYAKQVKKRALHNATMLCSASGVEI